MSADCLKILFIGNSHTYYNDMPSLVKQRFEAEGYEVTCLLRGLGEMEPIQELFVEHALAAVGDA